MVFASKGGCCQAATLHPNRNVEPLVIIVNQVTGINRFLKNTLLMCQNKRTAGTSSSEKVPGRNRFGRSLTAGQAAFLPGPSAPIFFAIISHAKTLKPGDSTIPRQPAARLQPPSMADQARQTFRRIRAAPCLAFRPDWSMRLRNPARPKG